MTLAERTLISWCCSRLLEKASGKSQPSPEPQQLGPEQGTTVFITLPGSIQYWWFSFFFFFQNTLYICFKIFGKYLRWLQTQLNTPTPVFFLFRLRMKVHRKSDRDWRNSFHLLVSSSSVYFKFICLTIFFKICSLFFLYVTHFFFLPWSLSSRGPIFKNWRQCYKSILTVETRITDDLA